MTSCCSPSFVASFVHQKISLWQQELILLCQISQLLNLMLHMLLLFMALLVNGIIWSDAFLCDSLLPLEEIICTKFLSNLTGQSFFSDLGWDLLALPPRLGGLDVIINPAKFSSFQFTSSVSITTPLVELTLQQSFTYIPLKFWCLSLLLNNRLSVLTINHWLICVMHCQL